MDIEAVRSYCLAKKGVTESFPFGKKPDLLVFKVMGKMFLSTDISLFEFIRLKFRPEDVLPLREQYPEVSKPAYANPNHWNNVNMLGALPDALIKQWIDDSYALVVLNLSKKQRDFLNQSTSYFTDKGLERNA